MGLRCSGPRVVAMLHVNRMRPVATKVRRGRVNNYMHIDALSLTYFHPEIQRTQSFVPRAAELELYSS